MIGLILVTHGRLAEEFVAATEHVVGALRRSPPLSVTMAERIDSLREWARDRCVPAD